MPVYREQVETSPDLSFRLLRWEGALRDVRVCIGPDEELPISGSGERWHAHRAIELTYITSGRGTRFVGDHLGAIEPPELVLIGADLPHYWSGLDDSSGVVIQFDLESHGGLGDLPEIKSLDRLWNAARSGLLYSQAAASELGDRILNLSRLASLTRLTELLSLLSRLEACSEGSARSLCEQPLALSKAAPHADQISRVITLLVDHYSEELRIDDLCEAVDLSRATLCRHFRRYTGRSVIAFLNGVRIDRARHLLEVSSDPISKIAFRVGFGNLSHFNKQFRLAVGESPSNYRRNYLLSAVGE